MEGENAPMMTSDITDSIPASPYRGILSFRYVDRARFFGREEVTTELLAKTLVSRVVVLFGESGTGKSSLINAGLIPALGREGLRPERLRVRPIPGEPILIERVPTGDVEDGHYLPSILVDDDPAGSGSREQFVPCTLERLLESVRGTDAYPVLIFDQFEELFTLFEQGQERGAQGRALQVDVLNTVLSVASDPRLRAKVIIVIREDYLGKLEVLARDYPQVFDRRIRLQRFVHSEARTAILGPFEDSSPFSSRLEGELAEQVIRDLSGGDPGVQIQPTQLQIICSRLWQAYAATRPVIGVREYEELGKVQGIIEGFLESELAGLAPSSRSQAVVVLGQLITESDTRDVVSEDRLRALMPTTEQIADDALVEILDFLERRRLVHRTPQRGTYYYEIGSEYLISPVQRMAREEAYYRAAEEAARQERKEALQRQAEMQAAAREREAIARRQADAARQRLRGRVALGVAVAGIIAMAFGVLAWYQRGAAIKARATVVAQLRVRNSLVWSSSARRSLDVDPERSLLVALHAVWEPYDAKESVPEEAQGALHEAILAMRLQRVLRGHADVVHGITFSPDGRQLATSSRDGTARVWDTTSGQELLVLSGDTVAVWDVAFSPDGERLATASADGTAKVWDATSGKVLLSLSGHADAIYAVAFAPDGKRLATASRDRTAKVWDLTPGELVSPTLEVEHGDVVWGVAFSPDGRWLATSSADGTARVWDVASGQELLSLSGHNGVVYAVAFGPGGARLATASADGTARVWNAASGDEMVALRRQTTHAVRDVAFDPEGKRLATASADGTATVWDAASGQDLYSLLGHDGEVYGIAFNRDATQLATASADGTARLWDPTSAQELPPVTGHAGAVYAVSFGPDGTRLATASADGTARVWDLLSGKEELSISGHSAGWDPAFDEGSIGSSLGDVYGIALSPDGARLATAGIDRTAKVWDLTPGQALSPILEMEHDDVVWGVAFSPDGKRLATASRDGTAKVWDLTPREVLSPILEVEHEDVVRGVAFSPDGRRLATASGDGTAKVWDATSGRVLLSFADHADAVYAVAFDPNGKRLATASADGTVKVWDLASGQELLSLFGHEDGVNGLAFSPNGARIATAGADGTAKVWAVEASVDHLSGRELFTLSGHTGKVWSVAFSPDGKRLVTGSADSTVRVYALDIEELMRIACQRVTRDLTDEECQAYLYEPCPPSPCEDVAAGTN